MVCLGGMQLNSTPKVELLFTKDRESWRLYTHGWLPPYVRAKVDQQGQASPVRQPDLEDLNKHMWDCDAPYVKRSINPEVVEIDAQGRSAIALWEWLDDHLTK